MAKQIAGLCNFVGTIDDMTFYRMEGKYYARGKSSLTSKRVKTSPEFRRTMFNAGLLARASKIGRVIYKALPPRWRQYWMYRSFTGEALLLLKHNPYTEQQVTQMLWDCYVKYWEAIKAADPDNIIFLPVPVKIRKRRKYSPESLERLRKRRGWKECKPREQQTPQTATPKEIIIPREIVSIEEAGKNNLLPAEKQMPIPLKRKKDLSTWYISPTGQLVHPLSTAQLVNPSTGPPVNFSTCQLINR